MTEAFRIFVYMSYVYVYYAVSSRPYYKQQWGKRRQTRQRKKDMAVILNNPLSKLIISRGNHHTFLRHALNNPKCQGRCALCTVYIDWLGRTSYITVGNDAIKYY